MSPGEVPAGPPHRLVLVGDPDWDTRTILLRALEHAGFEVHVAETGDALFDAASHDAADLIIAEIYLRCRKGRCAAQCVKSDPLLRRTPLLVYTSRVLPADEQWAREIGADGYLMKPARIETLLRAVRTLIENRRERERERDGRLPGPDFDLLPERRNENPPRA